MTAGTSRAGRFITLEGIEGTGKTTQLGRLAAALTRAGYDCVETREPGGTSLGRRLRALLLDPEGPPIRPGAELLLYTADRVQHLEQVVLPALERGAVVICDRYLDATLAYQGFARGLGVDRIRRLHSEPPLDLRPERTILLDLPPERALNRARERDRDDGSASREGRFEREQLAFHRRVREAYLELARAEPQRIRVVDASGEAPRVERRIVRELDDMFPAIEAS